MAVDGLFGADAKRFDRDFNKRIKPRAITYYLRKDCRRRYRAVQGTGVGQRESRTFLWRGHTLTSVGLRHLPDSEQATSRATTSHEKGCNKAEHLAGQLSSSSLAWL
jgi:hypothetical protein